MVFVHWSTLQANAVVSLFHFLLQRHHQILLYCLHPALQIGIETKRKSIITVTGFSQHCRLQVSGNSTTDMKQFSETVWELQCLSALGLYDSRA